MHLSYLNSLSSWDLPQDVSHMLFSGDIHGTTVSYGVGLFADIPEAVVSPGKSRSIGSLYLLLQLCADSHVKPLCL